MPSCTTTIAPALLAALQEAFAAASSLVPAPLRAQFVLIGSGAMLYHGYRRRARDVDIVGTAAAHGAFLERAREDGRFSALMDGAFVQYTASSGAGAGITVSIDLVELGGEAVPALKYEPMAFGDAFVASIPELWRMKARAFVISRPGEKKEDLPDFIWLTAQMARNNVEYDPVELLAMILAELRAR